MSQLSKSDFTILPNGERLLRLWIVYTYVS